MPHVAKRRGTWSIPFGTVMVASYRLSPEEINKDWLSTVWSQKLEHCRPCIRQEVFRTQTLELKQTRLQ